MENLPASKKHPRRKEFRPLYVSLPYYQRVSAVAERKGHKKTKLTEMLIDKSLPEFEQSVTNN